MQYNAQSTLTDVQAAGSSVQCSTNVTNIAIKEERTIAKYLPTVCHGQKAWLGVLEFEALISEG